MVFVSDATKALLDGNLVAFPTETVYGLGADAISSDAVAKIYQVKGRPANHPLIVHISSISKLNDWAREIPEYANSLAKDFWPGPMTLILKKNELAKGFITGKQDTVGLRIPNHPIALELLREFEKLGGQGVAAPSANKFGKVSPTTAQAVKEELASELSDKDVILDGGKSEVGLESSIIDCTQGAPRILRPGAITKEMIEQSTGLAVTTQGDEIRVSGALDNHYAPKAKVLLDIEPQPSDGYIALFKHETPTGVIRLSAPKTNDDFAQELYSALRLADQKSIKRVVVRQPEGDGIALAIRDRLVKASSKDS